MTSSAAGDSSPPSPHHAELPIDRGEIDRFVRAFFSGLDPLGYVSLRAFRQFPLKGEQNRPLHIEPIRLNLGLEPIIDAAVRIAARVSNGGEAAVFAPPVCTFTSRKGARSSDVHEAPALSVEIDQGDLQRVADSLSLILGARPTIALHSGSQWDDPETGALLPKGHLHWRLLRPARGSDQQKMLRRTRDIATLIAGGDPTGAPLVHPLRWPGSWNHKSKRPVMAVIIEENSTAIELTEALASLEDAAQASGIGMLRNASHLATPDPTPAEVAQIAEWLHHYPTAGLYWKDWTTVGLAIERLTGGSEAGFEVFRAWSATSPHYNLAGCRARWEEIKGCPGTWIGARYLRRKAIDHGWVEPTGDNAPQDRSSPASQTSAQRHAMPNSAQVQASPDLQAPGPDLTPDGDDLPPKPELEAGQDATEPPPPDDGAGDATFAAERDLPVIVVEAGKLHVLTDLAEAALIAAGAEIYQRGILVRPAIVELPAANDRKTQAAVLAELTAAGMLDELSQAAIWQRYNERKKRHVKTDPPPQAAAVLLARAGRWRFPYVRGIISTPTLRWDGSLITRPGLDEASGFYLALPSGFHMPAVSERPTMAEAAAALKLLEQLLVEFPFIDDGGVSHAVAVSGLITPIVRTAMQVAPLHAVTAPGIGTGKSYLVDLAAILATGRLCPVVFLGASDEELDKKLVGLLLAGVPLIGLDNARRRLDTDLLCQACERPLLELRRLGKSDTFTTPNGASLYATGNNLEVAGEMIRRTLRATMDAGLERPEPGLRGRSNRRGDGRSRTICRGRADHRASLPGGWPASRVRTARLLW